MTETTHIRLSMVDLGDRGDLLAGVEERTEEVGGEAVRSEKLESVGGGVGA